MTLAHGSRYVASTQTQSHVDPAGNAAVDRALGPIDNFVRAISRDSNAALRAYRSGNAAKAQAQADCILDSLYRWARADALGDLRTHHARLTVGSRITGIAMAYLQVRPFSRRKAEIRAVDAWLQSLSKSQAAWWRTSDTTHARRNNLRAWEALGFIAVGIATDHHALAEEGARITRSILCTANPDGSLPMEMRRGRLALHYQLHAVQPLTMSVALLYHRAPPRLRTDLRGACDRALQRAAEFALTDLRNGGRGSWRRSGQQQSFFDGSDAVKSYEMAWTVPFATLYRSRMAEDYLRHASGLRNSKLGGDQKVLWAG